MRLLPVDERDSSWEINNPRFRVYLHGSGEESTIGWTGTYDVTGADVLQVIDWAQRQAAGQLTYAVANAFRDAAEDADLDLEDVDSEEALSEEQQAALDDALDNADLSDEDAFEATANIDEWTRENCS